MAKTFEILFTGDDAQGQFQKMYEIFNATPTFEGDVARGPVLAKRNAELLDCLDEISVEDDSLTNFAGIPYARRLKPAAVLVLSERLRDALRGIIDHGQGAWQPWVQKKYIRPLLERIDSAKVTAPRAGSVD